MASASFKGLIGELAKTLKNGNLERLPTLLSSYNSSRQDWIRFADENTDPNLNYTRNNLVCLPDNLGQILVLIWKPELGSNIHDHPESECWIKLLEGEIEENIYHKDTKLTSTLKKVASRTVFKNETSRINDSIGLHSIHNRSSNENAVSLHVYYRVKTNIVSSGKKGDQPTTSVHRDFQNEFI